MRTDAISICEVKPYEAKIPCDHECHGAVPSNEVVDCPACNGTSVVPNSFGTECPDCEMGNIEKDSPLCPDCGKHQSFFSADYVCYACRRKMCPDCGGTGYERQGNVDAIWRTARDLRYNDLLLNEATNLEAVEIGAFAPTLVGTERVDGKQVNIFEDQYELYSLEEIRAAYPQGVDPKDMAWMFRRLLHALRLVHNEGYLHGAILPCNVLVQPEGHGVTLSDWAYSFKRPGRLKALVKAYREWYPPEVFQKGNMLGGTDIYMAAQCMEWIMMGQQVPDAITHFLKGCQLPVRPHQAKVVFYQFDKVVERLWGEKKFHEFSMPVAA